jgi:protein transport protein SEC24
MHKLLGASVRSTLYYLYPRMLAVHDLNDSIALPHPETGVIKTPSLMRGSHVFMQANGIYLIGQCLNRARTRFCSMCIC